MRILLCVCFLVLSLGGVSQDSLNFEFDSSVKFTHFVDHWILSQLEGTTAMDTVHSCLNDNNNGIIRQRWVSSGEYGEDILTTYIRNDRGQEIQRTVYKKQANVHPGALTNVLRTYYRYDKNSHLLESHNISCRRQALNEWRSDWKFSDEDKTKFFYNSSGKLSHTKRSRQGHSKGDSKYWYDSHGRLSKIISTSLVPDSVMISYTDSSRLEVGRFESDIVKLVQEIDSVYNDDKTLKKMEHRINQVNPVNGEDMGHWTETELFYYDDQKRVKKNEFYVDGYLKKTHHHFYRTGSNGGRQR